MEGGKGGFGQDSVKGTGLNIKPFIQMSAYVQGRFVGCISDLQSCTHLILQI